MICSKCGSDGPFYKSDSKRCRKCTIVRMQLARKKNPARLLAYRLYNALKNRRITIPAITSEECVERILQRCNGASVISAVDDVAQLCVFPVVADEYVEEAMVIVTMSEARKLHHMKPAKRAAILAGKQKI